MTAMLASVNSLAEAQLVVGCQVDVVDLKQPQQGALGALSLAEVVEIVAALPEQTVVSATIGDLPMQPELVCNAAQAMAGTGVDYVKIGLFPEGDSLICIKALAPLATKQALIAVLFADTQPDFGLLQSLAQSGFRGVMLDTMDKQCGSLPQILTMNQLGQFVGMAKQEGLVTGLAGSLRMADVDDLLWLNADYLGFRGALCSQHQRTAGLAVAQVMAIRERLAASR